MARLFPRLAPADAADRWKSLKDLSVSDLRARGKTSHQNQTFAAVGGQRIRPAELESIAVRVRQIAENHGYPKKGSRRDLSDFDTELAIYLGTELDIPAGEAYRPQTWAFFSLVLLPDVVMWRFPGFHTSRCTGGRRDCFQRLWLRAAAFDLGERASNRWVILQNLTEDSFVSIIERPSLAGNAEICKVLGLAWMKAASTVGRNRMEDVNRRAIKRIRSKGTIILLDSLDYGELKSLVEQCYITEAQA